MRLQALRAGIKKTVSGAAGAAAVTREAAREAAAAAGYAHAGGGYSFRRRKAAGALAEPSPGTGFCFASGAISVSDCFAAGNRLDSHVVGVSVHCRS